LILLLKIGLVELGVGCVDKLDGERRDHGLADVILMMMLLLMLMIGEEVVCEHWRE